MATRHGSAVVTLPTDTTICITRSFEASVERVWEALTTPRHVLRWWGPSWCPLVSCEIDLRPGGDWRYVARGQDGTELAWHGTFREIVAPHRSVSTEVFEGFPDAATLNTTTLTHAGGITTVETLVEHSSRENRDGHLQSGMEDGMQDTFDRLEELLGRADTTSERFRRVAGRFTDVAQELEGSDWDAPAPPDGWVARDVVGHMLAWMPGLLSGAGIELDPSPSVEDDPAGAWESLADQLQGLLDDPARARVEADFGPAGTLTVESAIGMIMLGDVLVHTWDLARAAGLDAGLDEGIAAEMLAGMEPMDDALRSSGHYGPRVPVPDDADVVTRLVAFTGRDPRWSG